MGVSLSLLLAAAGATLIWAVDGAVGDVDLATIGWVCVAAGAAGIVLSVIARGAFGERDTSTGEALRD